MSLETIWKARRTASKSDGKMAAFYRAAMRKWDEQKANGVPVAARLEVLLRTLREAWPKLRETEWKYLCTACSDYGLIMSDCPGDPTCGRDRPHMAHEYGTPCWCDQGRKFRQAPKPSPDDFTSAGKTSKGFTRVGK